MKLSDRIKIIDRKKKLDSRGWFLKILTGTEESLPKFTGEVYIVSALPGESRANHFHIETCEWFTLIQGKALLLLEDVDTKERLRIELDSENPQTIYVPYNIAHSFINESIYPYMLMAYTNKLYDSSDTIPYIF